MSNSESSPAIPKITSVDTYVAFLSHHLDFSDLGNGDPVLGMNIFIAMANVLATLASPCGVVVHTHGCAPVGVNLLSVDPVLNAAINREVITPLLELQGNAVQNFADMRSERITAIEGLHPSERYGVTRGLGSSRIREEEFLEMRPGLASGGTSRLLQRHEAGAQRREAISRPLVCVAGSTRVVLEEQLKSAHMGRPLTFLPIDRLEQVAPLNNLLHSLRQGTHTIALQNSGAPLYVGGPYVATVAKDVAAQVGSGNYSAASWPWHSVWLDLKTPYVPRTFSDKPEWTHVRNRYYRALRMILQYRYTEVELLLTKQKDLAEAQQSWSRRLNRICEGMGNLEAAASPMIATISLGLCFLLYSDRPEERQNYYRKQIEALAARVVRHSRRVCETFAEKHRARAHQAIADKLSAKLEQDPQSIRDLCRRSARLSAGDCLNGLLLLQQEGKAEKCEGRWSLPAVDATVVSAPRSGDNHE